LENADYESRSKKWKQDFSRNCKMPFKKLMYVHAQHGEGKYAKRPRTVLPENKRSDPYEPVGVQPGTAKSEMGSLSEIIPGKV
jgi:hypothetical protein